MIENFSINCPTSTGFTCPSSPKSYLCPSPRKPYFWGGGMSMSTGSLCAKCSLSVFLIERQQINATAFCSKNKLTTQSHIKTDECIHCLARKRNGCSKEVIGSGFTSQWLAEKVACVVASLPPLPSKISSPLAPKEGVILRLRCSRTCHYDPERYTLEGWTIIFLTRWGWKFWINRLQRL